MINTDTYIGPSFSMKNRISRVIWRVIYYIFFKYSPIPFHEWRSIILRCFGAKIGQGVHVYPDVNIWAPWNIEIGDLSGIANGTTLYSQDIIKIGRKVVISQDSFICTGTHDYKDIGFPLRTKPINIKDNVWIASKCFIHPGVTVGEGAVVGACSVVTKDIPSWMICSGNPCIPIKKRVLVN